MAESNPDTVYEIFMLSAAAFGKLGEIISALDSEDESDQAMAEEDMERLRQAVKTFGEDLCRISDIVKERKVALMKGILKEMLIKEVNSKFQRMYFDQPEEDMLSYVEPIVQPTMQLMVQPTMQLMVQPTMQPMVQPTMQLMVQPTMQPMVQPTMQPMVQPTMQPMVQPTIQPMVQPQSQRPSLRLAPSVRQAQRVKTVIRKRVEWQKKAKKAEQIREAQFKKAKDDSVGEPSQNTAQKTQQQQTTKKTLPKTTCKTPQKITHNTPQHQTDNTPQKMTHNTPQKPVMVTRTASKEMIKEDELDDKENHQSSSILSKKAQRGNRVPGKDLKAGGEKQDCSSSKE